MAALSGFWHPVFGSTQQDPTNFASWDATHQQRYVGTGANRLIVTPTQSTTLENDVLNWIVGGSGRPTLGVHNRRSHNQRLWNLSTWRGPSDQATTENYTEDILDSYDNDGYSDAIWGYVVNHEDTNPGSSPYWENLGWVVNKIASEKPGKAILAVGDLESYGQIDTFLQKLWASADGVMITEKYVWQSGTSTEAAVQEEENAWRFAADKSKNLSTGNPNKWMGIVACHREIRDGNEYYRYPTNYELRYTALGPIAHGGQGTIFFLFEGGWDSSGTRQYQAVYENSTQRTYVTNAITRMNQVAGYLAGYTYQAYAHGNNLPGSWRLDSIGSGDPSNPLNILEVCQWTGPDGEEVYALCNRDPSNPKFVYANFDGTYLVYYNGASQGNRSSFQFALDRADVAVLRLE